MYKQGIRREGACQQRRKVMGHQGAAGLAAWGMDQASAPIKDPRVGVTL